MLYINDRLQELDLEASLPLLSEQRREQVLRFRHEQGRRECCAAYLLLCEGLQKEYGITEKPVFVYGEHGKPAIKGHPEIHFNMSHCREAAICMLSDKPVGVDVERVRTLNEGLMRYTMNDQEQEEILSAYSPDLAFTMLWTRKEAALKCMGVGINDELKTILANPALEITTEIGPKGRYVFSICNDVITI